MPYPSSLPARPTLKPGLLAPPREAVEFPQVENQKVLVDGVPVERALAALSANRNVQEVTGLDSDKLLAYLSKKWTAEQALKECKQGFSMIAARKLRFCPQLWKYNHLQMHFAAPPHY
jgi:protein EFR3